MLQKSHVRLSRVQQEFEPEILRDPRADDTRGCIMQDLVNHLECCFAPLLGARQPERFTGHTDTVARGPSICDWTDEPRGRLDVSVEQLSGAAYQNRTGDLFITSESLYRLS